MHDVKYQQESFYEALFVPFLTNFIDDLGEIGIVPFIFNGFT